jgi:hypothetical protein
MKGDLESLLWSIILQMSRKLMDLPRDANRQELQAVLILGKWQLYRERLGA